jgi:hypothetical protein
MIDDRNSGPINVEVLFDKPPGCLLGVWTLKIVAALADTRCVE